MPNIREEQKDDDLSIELDENPVILSRLNWLLEQRDRIDEMIRTINQQRLNAFIRELDAPTRY